MKQETLLSIGAIGLSFGLPFIVWGVKALPEHWQNIVLATTFLAGISLNIALAFKLAQSKREKSAREAERPTAAEEFPA